MSEANTLNFVPDYSVPTVRALASLLDESVGFAQLVYREAELDELWRLVQTALREAERSGDPVVDVIKLQYLLGAVTQAHDFVGSNSDPLLAARALREAVTHWSGS